jgi:cytochrome c peroxidase
MSATRASSSDVRNALGLRMRNRPRLVLLGSAALASVWVLAIVHATSTFQTIDQTLSDLVGLTDPTGAFDNASGRLQTVSLDGAIDTHNAFFQDLGTNGRACVTCHAPRDGWSTSVASLQRRFFATCKGDAKQLDPNHDNGQSEFHADNGRGRDGDRLKPPSCGDDPIFRLVDGATSPTADVSTDEARLRAYSLLLSRGVIRIELLVPADAEFEIVGVDDPYGYATTTRLDFYRRPLPATNLRFSEAFEDNIANGVAIMWDGRETGTTCVAATPPGGFSCGSGLPLCPVGQSCVTGLCRIVPQCGNPPTPRSPFNDLKAQAQHAFARHSEGMAPLSDDQLDAIVSFERGLFTAQAVDNLAGSLSDGASGGPDNLSLVPFTFAENRPVAAGRGPVPQDPIVFTSYDGWSTESTNSEQEERRASIARGQALFNTRTGVSPILGPVVSPNPVRCSTCHNAFNAGGESASPWGNGVQNGIGNFTSSAAMSAGLPMYTVRNKITGELIQTSDLGRGMVTGKWNDINKFKVPVLRGLAGHAPYFHNGSAATLGDVIDAYQAAGFQFNFTPQERADLIAFLKAL